MINKCQPRDGIIADRYAESKDTLTFGCDFGLVCQM